MVIVIKIMKTHEIGLFLITEVKICWKWLKFFETSSKLITTNINEKDDFTFVEMVPSKANSKSFPLLLKRKENNPTVSGGVISSSFVTLSLLQRGIGSE